MIEKGLTVFGAKRSAFVGAGAVAVFLALSAVAWACTQTAFLEPIVRPAAAGEPVSVTGGSFSPGVVEIRWNSAEGRVVGTGSGPSLSASVAVPLDSAPGVYYLVAVQKDSAGTIVNRATASIEVSGRLGAGPAQLSGGKGGFQVPADGSSISAVRSQAEAGAGGPSSKTTTDLWSGFEGTSAPAQAAVGSEPLSQGPSGIAFGMGLLTVGATGVLGFVAVTAARRAKKLG